MFDPTKGKSPLNVTEITPLIMWFSPVYLYTTFSVLQTERFVKMSLTFPFLWQRSWVEICWRTWCHQKVSLFADWWTNYYNKRKCELIMYNVGIEVALEHISVFWPLSGFYSSCMSHLLLCLIRLQCSRLSSACPLHPATTTTYTTWMRRKACVTSLMSPFSTSDPWDRCQSGKQFSQTG